MPQTAERRGERMLRAERLRAPARFANIARNAGAGRDRRARWAPARDALWQALDPILPAGGRVGIVGAGNGDDLPLARLAQRAAELVLVDLDGRASRGARRRQPRSARRRIDVIEHDITDGASDAIAISAARDQAPASPVVSEAPLPGAPYDLVIGDLFYSQLLFPGLLDLGISGPRRDAVIARCGPALTRAAVSRLHVSAPYGQVLHLHDPVGWWDGHAQPVTLAEILTVSQRSSEVALRLAAHGVGPCESDPRLALAAFGIPIRATWLWRWPFSAGVEYLACATLAGAP